jgi:hypothetical protein
VHVVRRPSHLQFADQFGARRRVEPELPLSDEEVVERGRPRRTDPQSVCGHRMAQVVEVGGALGLA